MPLGYANGSYLHASGTRASFEGASAQLEREGYPPIVVNWGDREYETQVRVFLERYVTAANVRGRKVYSTSVWNGVRYYRISAAGVVAVPSPNAPHVARRAADLAYPYNSNTPARRRLVQIAAAHDLAPTGENFDELWHFEKKGNPGTVTSSGGSASTPTRPSEEDDMNEAQDFMLQHLYYSLTPGVSGRKTDGDVFKLFVETRDKVASGLGLLQALGEVAERARAAAQTAADSVTPGIAGVKFDGSLYSLVKNGTAVVDEKAIAAELAPILAPLLSDNVGTLSDETITSLVKRLLDEQSKRLAS